MKTYALRLLEDRLQPGCEIVPAVPARNRVIYVVEGDVTVTSEGGPQMRGANEAWFGAAPCSVEGGAHGARLWRWELVSSPPADDGAASGNGVASTAKLTQALDLDPQGAYLMRCDRVDFPLGGKAYTHQHQGPGIRCLLRGEFTVTVYEKASLFHPGDPWFEAGPDPVYAEASTSELSSFARAMVLPRSLKGRSSIRYVRDEDRDKPKTQTYTMFVDEFVEL